MKSVLDMTDAEFDKAKAEAIRRSKLKPAPTPPDKRPASEMTPQEWAAAHPAPKLATEMSEDEYRVALAALIRR